MILNLVFLITLAFIKPPILTLSLHESGFGAVYLHTSIDKYPFLKPVRNTFFTKDFYFYPEEKYYYSYDVSSLPTDIPGALKGVFIGTDKQDKIVKITLFIADKQDLLKPYMIDKFSSHYSFMEAGADQVGTRIHYFWTTSINSSIYYLPKKYDERFPSTTLSVIEITFWSDFDLLEDYSISPAFHELDLSS